MVYLYDMFKKNKIVGHTLLIVKCGNSKHTIKRH